MPEMPLRHAAIWKNAWLPYTETFVRDQMAATTGWAPVKIGFHNLPDGIDTADYAPYSSTKAAKVTRLALGAYPFLRSYRALISESDVQLIHAHFGSGGINSLPIASDCRVPLVTTFHGADTHFYGSSLGALEARYRRGLGKLFTRGSYFLAASRYLADRLVSNGAPSSRVEVLYTGTKPVELLKAPEREGIIYVGRLIPIKGPDHLLRAVGSFKSPELRRTKITFVGDGPMRPYLERLATELGLNVAFLGRATASEVPRLLSHHQVFCGPSVASPRGTREGFGMVFLEAAMQEVPAIGYKSGGVKEAVQDGTTGLLASEGDVEELAHALVTLLTDDQARESMGTAARRRALAEFNIDLQGRRLSAFYEHLTRA